MEDMKENELIIVEQLPIIREQLENLGNEIDVKVEKAVSLVCNEENRKDVKDVRADLNKQFNELEEQRKAVKKAVLDPYNKFEEVYKEFVTQKFKHADNELKTKIDNVENQLKLEKETEIVNYFNEYANSLKIDFVKFSDMKLNITLTASKASLKKSVDNYLNKINTDLGTIELQEHKEEMLVEYKKNGYDLNNAITTVLNRMESIKAEKEKQEQLAKQKEIEQQTVAKVEEVAAVEQPLQVPLEEKAIGIDTMSFHVIGTAESKQVETYTMSFKVTGTIEQLKAVKSFLEKEGIKYE